MRWTWDPAKNRTNRRSHGINFEAAIYVFDDPLAATREDPYPALHIKSDLHIK